MTPDEYYALARARMIAHCEALTPEERRVFAPWLQQLRHGRQRSPETIPLQSGWLEDALPPRIDTLRQKQLLVVHERRLYPSGFFAKLVIANGLRIPGHPDE